MHNTPTVNLACDVGGTVGQDDFDVELIDTLEAFQTVRGEWREFIAGNVCGKNFFNDPAQIELQSKREPQFKPHMIVLRRGGQIRCIAPFYLCDGRFLLQLSVVTLASLPVRLLKVFGDDFVVSAEENWETCCRTIFENLQQGGVEDRIIQLDELNASTPLWDYCLTQFASGARLRTYLASPQLEKHHQIHFPETYNEYLLTIGSETRQGLRRKTRKLCEKLNARLERVESPAQVPRFVEQLDGIARDTWQAKTFGYRPRNTDSERRYLTGIAERGWLRSYLLVSDQGPLAYVVGYQHEGVYHYQEPGFSQAWASYGPGSVLLHLLIEDFYQGDPPRALDFGVGEAGYKRSFGNVQFDAAALYLVPRSRWRQLISFQRMLFALERKARALLTTLKLDRAVRKFLKRQH